MIVRLLEVNFRLDGVRGRDGLARRGGARAGRGVDPDAIVLDVMMPGLDGYEVCRAPPRRMPTLAAMPVVFLTARTPGRRRRGTGTPRMWTVRPKPFDPVREPRRRSSEARSTAGPPVIDDDADRVSSARVWSAAVAPATRAGRRAPRARAPGAPSRRSTATSPPTWRSRSPSGPAGPRARWRQAHRRRAARRRRSSRRSRSPARGS